MEKEHIHNFEPDSYYKNRGGYFKEDGGRNPQVAYNMLVCACGATKEVIVADHRSPHLIPS